MTRAEALLGLGNTQPSERWFLMAPRAGRREEIPLVSWTRRGKVWISPEMELKYAIEQGAVAASRCPDSCIICYQGDLEKLAREKLSARKIETLLGFDLYAFEHRGKEVGVIRSGIGAPMAALILERLIVRGLKRVVNAGIAGALQHEGFSPGDLVLCTKAVRNEGVSYHYQQPSRCVFADETLVRDLEHALEMRRIAYHKGPTISIDAPYRFTIKEALRLRREGVLTSDMEASAVFAVSRFRGVQAAALFIISDLLTEELEWNPQFHSKRITESFEVLLEVCAEALAK